MTGDQQTTYDVATFGISDSELEVLRRIFVVSADRPNTFRLQVAGSDPGESRIMMLDRNNPGDVSKWAKAHQEGTRQPPSIILTQNDTGDDTLSLRRPLIATRVLAALDRAVKAIDTPRTPPLPVDDKAFQSSTTMVPERKYQALVVDDSLPVRKQIGMALDKVNVKANFAESGEQALSALENSDYDIVFLDVMMPGIDGYDACKRIKNDPRKRHIPVVLLTGNSSALDRVKGKMSGCDSYLAKPVSKDQFYQTLRKYLTQKTAVR